MNAKRKEQAPAPGVQNGFSLISNLKLLDLYSAMLRGRMIQERLRNFHKQNKLAMAVRRHAGHEAALAGVAIDLFAGDTVCSVPSDLIPLSIKGLPLAKLLAGLFSPAPSPSAAARLKRAVAAAMGNKTNQNNKIAVVFSTLPLTDHTPGRTHCVLPAAMHCP